MTSPNGTPPFLRRVKLVDPETDLVGDTSVWTRSRLYFALGALVLVAVMGWFLATFRLGGGKP